MPFANPARPHELGKGGRYVSPRRSRSFTDVHCNPATDGLVPMRARKSAGQLVEVLQDGTTQRVVNVGGHEPRGYRWFLFRRHTQNRIEPAKKPKPCRLRLSE